MQHHEQQQQKPEGLLRLRQIIPGLVSVAPSTWCACVKSGRFPQPVRLGNSITCLRREDIKTFIDSMK